MKRNFALTSALFALLIGMLACSGPEREIRERLSTGEREHFDRGRRLSTACWACHDLYGEQNKVGPYLAGVFGRRAGSAKFPGYSEAMKQSRVVWDERSLRAFLLDPSGFIPGTTMVAGRPRSMADVGALVFYLQHVTQAVVSEKNSP